MKIIFMGTPQYAFVILQKLLQSDDIEVAAVYTQPDKEVGRKKVLTPPVVKVLAQEHSVPVYQPNRLRDMEVVDELLKIECDYIVVAAYGQILPKEILSYKPCINLHASILPFYRGASPIQQTLLNGDNTTGVTAMLMDEGLDTGDIIKITRIEVDKNEMSQSLFNRLSNIAADLTLDVLRNFNSYKPIKQDNAKATHCKKITKTDGEIEFDDAQEIFNKYRAFTPWPTIYLKSGLKLKDIELNDTISQNQSGKILDIQKNFVIVGCKQGSIKIFKVQPESKNEMEALSYVNGKRLKVADLLS